MRRYVQYDRPVTKTTKSKRPKQSRTVSKLSAEELQSLPVALQAGLSISKPVKPVKPAKEKKHYEPIDEEFIAKRAPGSKTLRYSRTKKRPLATFEDRLNRMVLVSREDDTFKFRGHTFHVIEWKCRKPEVKDVNIHLPSLDEEVEYTYIYKITLESPTKSEFLLETPAGRVCPKCKTNEYIRSELKNMPISFQDANWRNRDKFGEYCEMCRCISK